MILTKTLPPGAAIQERRLADALGVSRTPLRGALSRLEGEGLIVRQPARGLVVKEVTITEYIEVLHVRRILETEAVALAMKRVAPEELERVCALVEALIARAKPTVAEHWAADDAVHDLIAVGSGNDFMAGIIRDLRRRTRMFNLKRMPDRFLPGCQEHLAILRAMRAGDQGAAQAAMAAHIDNVRASILGKLAEL